jgi:hypothetical protein
MGEAKRRDANKRGEQPSGVHAAIVIHPVTPEERASAIKHFGPPGPCEGCGAQGVEMFAAGPRGNFIWPFALCARCAGEDRFVAVIDRVVSKLKERHVAWQKAGPLSEKTLTRLEAYFFPIDFDKPGIVGISGPPGSRDFAKAAVKEFRRRMSSETDYPVVLCEACSAPFATASGPAELFATRPEFEVDGKVQVRVLCADCAAKPLAWKQERMMEELRVFGASARIVDVGHG